MESHRPLSPGGDERRAQSLEEIFASYIHEQGSDPSGAARFGGARYSPRGRRRARPGGESLAPTIPRLLVSLSSRRPFVHPVFVLDAPRPSFLPPRSGPDEPRLFRPSTQVYPGETARELCERVLVRGFDFGRTPEVTWGDVRVPLKDRLDELSGGKSRRINFGSGTTTFTVKIPSGARVATAAKPSPRGEVGAGVDGDGLFDGLKFGCTRRCARSARRPRA